MNMLDPRQIFMNPFVYNIDPSTAALLGTTPGTQNSAAGKMNLNNSFRISDILESSEERANTSGERESSSVGEEERSGSVESRRSVTSPQSSASCGKKARKARTIFTDKQLQELEATFDKQKYLSVQDRMDLAQRMGLSDTQVKTWYQNRRTKWKRQAAVGMDLLNEASNVAAVQQLLRTNPYWANYMAASSLSQPRLFPFQTGSTAAFQSALPLSALQGAIPSPLPHSALPTIAIPSSASATTITSSSFQSAPMPFAMFPFQLPPTAGFALNLTHCTPAERPKTPPSSDVKGETK